jgi:hypothetical protein
LRMHSFGNCLYINIYIYIYILLFSYYLCIHSFSNYVGIILSFSYYYYCSSSWYCKPHGWQRRMFLKWFRHTSHHTGLGTRHITKV